MNPCRSNWQRKWLDLDITSPTVQVMADAVERFCSSWFKNRQTTAMLVLSGPSGVGKTKCARAVANWASRMAFAAMEAGNWGTSVPSVAFFSWPSVTDGFKAGEYGVLDDCFSVSLLVIDDIGAEHDPSRNAADKLCQILSRRGKKFTLITTNISPENWATKFDERIADRLMRNSIVIDLSPVQSYSVII